MFIKLVVSSILLGLCLAAQPPYNFPSTNSCIKVEFDNLKTNTLTWTDSNNKTYDAVKWDFSNTSIQNNSKCAEVNGTTALLEVLFAVDNATFAFTFTKQNGMVQINMTLKFVPRVVFSKDNNTQQDQVIMAVSVPFSVPEKQSYQCDAAQGYSQKVTVGNNTYNMDLVFQKVHMQAFGISNSTFSEAVHCAADQNSTTTVKPTPAPPTPDQHPKFYVNVTDNKFNNTGCISVDAMMMISVPYKTKDNKTATVKLGVQQPNANGSCDPNDEFIEMVFQNKFTIIITFGMSGKNVYWKNATVSGIYDSKFNNSASQGERFSTTANFSTDTLMFPKGGSYVCDAHTSLNVGNVTLEIWNLQYMAYQTNTTSFPKDNVQLCKGDRKTNSIVPIAVGAALAGLVVIVLIAYLIGRRRNRKGYESV